MRDLKIDWLAFDCYVGLIISKMSRDRYRPDFIYGLPRGGLPLAVTLSNRLNVPLALEMPKDKTKRILVVDDISDTGSQLYALLKKYEGMNIKIATLLYRKGSSVVPDYYGESLFREPMNSHRRWVVFPWESGR